MTEIVYVRVSNRSKVTPEDVLDIRRIYAEGGIKMRELAEQYGVTIGCISHIITRRTYKDI